MSGRRRNPDGHATADVFAGPNKITHPGPPYTAASLPTTASSSVSNPPYPYLACVTRPRVATPVTPLRAPFHRVKVLAPLPAELKYDVCSIMSLGGVGVVYVDGQAL